MFRFHGGSQTIAFKIAAQELKRRIYLNKPVKRIVQGPNGVRVECDGLTVRGKRVIIHGGVGRVASTSRTTRTTS